MKVQAEELHAQALADERARIPKKRRKMCDEFRILGHYAHGWEEVTCETTRAAAMENLRAYRENEPGTAFKLKVARVPVEGAN